MMLQKHLDKGDLYIFDDVIKYITSIAFSEIDGVECSSTTIKSKVLDTIIGNPSNINIKTTKEEVSVQLKVSIRLGKNIPDTIYELQSVVKNHVELFTGFTVSEVNVLVDGIIIDE